MIADASIATDGDADGKREQFLCFLVESAGRLSGFGQRTERRERIRDQRAQLDREPDDPIEAGQAIAAAPGEAGKPLQMMSRR